METQITTKSTDAKLKYVEIKIEHYTEIRKKLMDDLVNNFYYYLQWNAEQIFRIDIQIAIYKNIVEDYDEFGDVAFLHAISKLQQFVNRSYNIRTSSTNAIVREQSTWEYQTKLEILDELKDLCKETK